LNYLQKYLNKFYVYLFKLAFFIYLCLKSIKFNLPEESIRYKKLKNILGFADFALAFSMKYIDSAYLASGRGCVAPTKLPPVAGDCRSQVVHLCGYAWP